METNNNEMNTEKEETTKVEIVQEEPVIVKKEKIVEFEETTENPKKKDFFAGELTKKTFVIGLIIATIAGSFLTAGLNRLFKGRQHSCRDRMGRYEQMVPPQMNNGRMQRNGRPDVNRNYDNNTQNENNNFNYNEDFFEQFEIDD